MSISTPELSGVQRGADRGRLEPEGGPPARLLGQLAANLVVAVLVHELGRRNRGDGPVKLLAVAAVRGPIHVVAARLKLRGVVVAVLLIDFQQQIALAVERGGVVGPGLVPPVHHVEPEVPLGPIQLGAVELVAPHELPFLARGQMARHEFVPCAEGTGCAWPVPPSPPFVVGAAAATRQPATSTSQNRSVVARISGTCLLTSVCELSPRYCRLKAGHTAISRQLRLRFEGKDMDLVRAACGIIVLTATGFLAFGQEARIHDQLPPISEGKTWKLVWHDEFDGTKLDETKWDIPRVQAPGRLLVPQGGLAGRQGPSGHERPQGRRQVPRRLRADQGQVRACFRLLRRPHPTSEAAGPLVGVLDHGRRRRQGRQRGPGRHGDRHHGEAVAGRSGAADAPLGRLRQGPQVRRARSSRCPA